MSKISNKTARGFVQVRAPFKGSNTFAEVINGVFVVFSYGYHFPLFAHINGVWYENADKYSPSTSKQQSQLHPLAETVKLDTLALKAIYA
jgi:hypothetical protein